MSQRPGKKRARAKRDPFYSLPEVKKLVRDGAVLIRRNALDGARDAFGWNSDDILDALRRLQVKHFHKSAVSRINPQRVLDFYKARRLKGENVYIHFYVDDDTGKLIINSFKEI